MPQYSSEACKVAGCATAVIVGQMYCPLHLMAEVRRVIASGDADQKHRQALIENCTAYDNGLSMLLDAREACTRYQHLAATNLFADALDEAIMAWPRRDGLDVLTARELRNVAIDRGIIGAGFINRTELLCHLRGEPVHYRWYLLPLVFGWPVTKFAGLIVAKAGRFLAHILMLPFKAARWLVSRPSKVGRHPAVGSKGAGTLSLRCPVCGQHYDVGYDSTIVTMEDVYRLTAHTVVFTGGSPPVRMDMVALLSNTPPERLEAVRTGAREKVKTIRSALEAGHQRFWYCRACGEEKGLYPYPN
jgi:hypothetical protein